MFFCIFLVVIFVLGSSVIVYGVWFIFFIVFLIFGNKVIFIWLLVY